MAENPVAGWYADPADPTRQRYWNGAEWTKRTRAGASASAPAEASSSTVSSTDPFGTGATSAQPAPVRTGTIAAIALGVLVAVGAGVAVAMSGGDSPEPRPTDTSIATDPGIAEPTGPAPSPTVSAHPFEMPEGWVVKTSERGSFTFAYDGAWESLLGETGYREALQSSFEGAPGARLDIGEAFLLDGSLLLGGSSIQVLALSDGTAPRSLGLQLRLGVEQLGSQPGVEDHAVTDDRPVTTAQGLEGHVLEYTYSAAGETFTNAIALVATDTTMYMVQITVMGDEPEEYLGYFQVILDSIVPQFPL